jgi:transposase
MRRRYEVSNRQWERLRPLFPHPTHHGHRGRPWEPHRRIVNAVLWILHTGAPWRDVPERYGPWETVYGRFRRWRRDGTWSKVLTCLLSHLERHGRLGRRLWCVDGTVVRASRAAGGAVKQPRVRPCLEGPISLYFPEPKEHGLGYSRGGFGTKVHLLCDAKGIILGVYVTPGQRHESKAFEPLTDHVFRPRRRGKRFWPYRMAGDKGYSYPHIRRWMKRHGIQPVIPTRRNQVSEKNFDKETYKKRNIIERVVGWFKECRRLGTRYEKLAVNYVAFWMVAMIDKLLHLEL